MATKKKAWYQVFGFVGGKYVPTTVEGAHYVRVLVEDGKYVELYWDEARQMFNLRANGQLEVVHNVANDCYLKVRGF